MGFNSGFKGLKCFDKFINLKKFLEGRNDNEEFFNLLAHLKWEKYFENSTNVDCRSEFLKIAPFFFVAPSHNAHAERIFSLTPVQWKKKREKNLNIESAKGTLLLQCNYKHPSGKECHGYLRNSQQVLTKIQSTEKYALALPESELL